MRDTTATQERRIYQENHAPQLRLALWNTWIALICRCDYQRGTASFLLSNVWNHLYFNSMFSSPNHPHPSSGRELIFKSNMNDDMTLKYSSLQTDKLRLKSILYSLVGIRNASASLCNNRMTFGKQSSCILDSLHTVKLDNVVTIHKSQPRPKNNHKDLCQQEPGRQSIGRDSIL